MPRYGFNFQWMFQWEPERRPAPADERSLDLMAGWGLDFVRIPTDYRYWTRGCDYAHPDEQVWDHIDGYLDACRRRRMHLCLNLHRAPGYCINRIELETHRLWRDVEAQDGFVHQWEMLAHRYRGVSNDELSFDLVNEPAGTDAGRRGHEKVIRRTVAAIRAIDTHREIAIDGWRGGNDALTELADLNVIQSTRGYQPGYLSHYQAGWTALADATTPPVWPGQPYDDRTWDTDEMRRHYQPWRELETRGRTVHVGEFGCYNKTHNDIALAWFADLLGLFREFRWGYSLWNFDGPFGIVNHGRPGAVYEMLNGLKVDRALLDMYLANRVD